MPYAPGVQDISGQLLAQGMSQAGQIKARALSGLGESIADTITGGMKQYQQNQLFTNQALGKFGLAMQDPTFKAYVQGIANDDPNAPQVPDAIKKAIKNASAGKLDIYDASLLGSVSEGFSPAERLKRLQADKLQAQLDQLKKLGQIYESINQPEAAGGAGANVVTQPGATTPAKRFTKVEASTAGSPLERATGELSLLNSLKAFAGPSQSEPTAMINAQPFAFAGPAAIPSPVAAPVSVPVPASVQPATPQPALPQPAKQQPRGLNAQRAGQAEVPPPPLPSWFSETQQSPLGPEITLSPEAKAIARQLREQYEASQPSEGGREPARFIGATSDVTPPKRKTITLDAEGIKAILSDPRILVESFADVAGDPYQQGLRRERLDQVMRQQEQLRALEQMMRQTRRGR